MNIKLTAHMGGQRGKLTIYSDI